MRADGILTKGKAWLRGLVEVVNRREMRVVTVEVAISRGGEVEACMARLSMRTWKRSLHAEIKTMKETFGGSHIFGRTQNAPLCRIDRVFPGEKPNQGRDV